MSGLAPAERFARSLRAAVWTAGALCVVLAWGSWLVLGANVGTHVCEAYTQQDDGANRKLASWCRGEAWHGWLAAWLLVAAVVFAVGAYATHRRGRAWPVSVAAAAACAAVWMGFAFPQAVAGPATVRPPRLPAQLPLGPASPPIGRAHRLPRAIRAEPLFRCPEMGGSVVTRPAPNGGSVALTRGPRGLCASVTGVVVPIDASALAPVDVVSLTFCRRCAPTNDIAISPDEYRVTLLATGRGPLLSLSGEAKRRLRARAGAVGVARLRASLLFTRPLPPAWVLDARTRWTFSIGPP